MEALESILAMIIELLNKIQTEEKIGTAYERYESRYLWDLGRCIRKYTEVMKSKEDITAEIIRKLQSRSIRCQPVMLKNAETITKIWPTRADFLKVAQGVPYGKLRDAISILDPDFVTEHKVSEDDISRLVRFLKSSTFEELRNFVKELKSKYDPLGESVNFDQMWEDIFQATNALSHMVKSKNKSSLERFRVMFTPGFIENSRKLIAAMKSEEALQKLRAGISDDSEAQGASSSDLESRLFRIAHDLSLLARSSSTRREALRRRIGVSGLGKLSTLMKAASTEVELERYLRSREMLERLTSVDPI